MQVDFNKKFWQFSTLMLLGLTWGSSFILMKQGLKSFSADEVAAIRLSASFLFLFPLLLTSYKKIPKKYWKFLLLAGLLGNGIPAFLFATAQTRIDSSLAGILNATAPIFTFIVGTLFFSLMFKKTTFWGILIGLIGTSYLIYFNSDSSRSTDYAFAVLPVIAAVCYGFSTNIIKSKLQELTPLIVTGGALTFVGPPSILYLFFMSDVPTQILNDSNALTNLFYVIILGVVGTSIAVLIFNYLIRHTTALFAASVTYIVPVFAISWGALLGENITIHYFIGIVIILFGVYLTNK
jgi:drug/metabolite transporter (DMT)-like permease